MSGISTVYLNPEYHEKSFKGLGRKPNFKLFTLIGQLILKGLFGVFNSSKNERKQVDLRYHSTVSQFFSFVFGRIQDTNKSFQN